MTYTQTALTLDAVPSREDVSPACAPPITQPTYWPTIPAHTGTPSIQRLPDDLWDEYRLECVMRETLALPFVSLMEFADMRDWTDTREETEDGNGEHRSDPDPLRPRCSPYRRDRSTT